MIKNMDPITLLVFLVVGCVIFIPMWNLIKEAEIFAESHLDKQIMFYDAYKAYTLAAAQDFLKEMQEDISGGSTYYNASDVKEIQFIIEKLKSK